MEIIKKTIELIQNSPNAFYNIKIGLFSDNIVFGFFTTSDVPNINYYYPYGSDVNSLGLGGGLLLDDNYI